MRFFNRVNIHCYRKCDAQRRIMTQQWRRHHGDKRPRACFVSLLHGAAFRCFLVCIGFAAMFVIVAWPKHAQAGTLVSARCLCGYHQDGMPLFGGRANFKKSCLFPALCPSPRELVLLNVLDVAEPVHGCPTGCAVRYDDPSLAPIEPGEPVASWNVPGLHTTLTIYSGGYVCPRCGERTLHFMPSGFWD